MSATNRHNFTTPVARMVNGNLYTPLTKDADGKPLLIKNGPNTGQPTQKYYMAVAIPKRPGEHWASWPRDPKRPEQESWGQAIWNAGNEAFPQAAQSPGFAWKITDGDSQVPNKKGRAPYLNEGWAGCWIVHCGGSFAPKCYNSDGSAAILEPNAIKAGYYVQVAGNAVGNQSTQNPGVHVNPSMVSLQGYGPEIVSGPDASAVGFGGAPLPPGASTAPVAGFTPPATPGVPPLPPAGHPVHAPGYAPPPPSMPQPAAPLAVAPHPGILTPPPAAPAPFPPAPLPGAPLPPPAAPVRVMLPAAGAYTYEQLTAIGWTDATLRASGMMA